MIKQKEVERDNLIQTYTYAGVKEKEEKENLEKQNLK